MSRRKKSFSNIYHVILRGVNQQQIFEDSRDFQQFLFCIEAGHKVAKYELHAYCLMGNHVHLLIKADLEQLAKAMHCIQDKFVIWYNHKYDRCGHLFQGRYLSFPIESESYYMQCYRYILQNPVKAGIADRVTDYNWSSVGALANSWDNLRVNTNLIEGLFNSRNEMLAYMLESNEDEIADLTNVNSRYKGSKYLSDDDVRKIIFEISGCSTPSEFQQLTKEDRDAYLFQILEHHMPVRQLSRLTGISRTSITRAARRHSGTLKY